MSYGVQKVTAVHGKMWEHSKFVVTLQKGQEKINVKITGLVHYFIIKVNVSDLRSWYSVRKHYKSS